MTFKATTTVEKFESKVVRKDGCWGWTGSLNRTGYTRLTIDGVHTSGHRISYRLFVGEIPDGMCVLHHCDNRSCCNPSHLFIGTRKDNTHDAMSKKRLAFGSRHHASKLTEDNVREIRKLYEMGHSKRGLARRYGVTPPAIRMAIKRVWWRHVE